LQRVFVENKPLECFESSGEVVCVEEVIEMSRQLCMVVVVEAMDGGFLGSRAVHSDKEP
jgi:hypothetical protein